MRISLLALSLLFLAAFQQDSRPATAAAPADGTHGTTVRVTPLTPAPNFTLPDTRGGTHSLSDFRGQYVVLEWLNYDCPFVRKHYEGESMQATQARWTGEGVTWLAIVSNAPGEQGHFPNDVMNRRSEEYGGRQTAILMDEDGEVGRAYGARTTPQMVVISPEGEILYNGAIDDRPSANRATLEGATNYVDQVMEEALAGRPISVSATQPYGCSVKYAS
jgi:peroxiredoxin